MVLPLGVRMLQNTVYFSVAVPNEDECRLNLYKKGEDHLFDCITISKTYRTGNIFAIAIEDFDFTEFEYMYEVKGKEFVDPYAKVITGNSTWGKLLSKEEKKQIRGGFVFETFDWEGDKPLCTPFKDLILYRLHLRGFTKHSSSKVKNKGTFRGLEEKISYLKDLGVNALELMPIYNFNEIIEQHPLGMSDSRFINYTTSKEKDENKELPFKVNYWGYSKESYYFAPKASYASDTHNPVRELKNLVKKLHENQMEVIMEMSFAPGTNQSLIMECLRHWVLEYHIDGFRFNNEVVPAQLIATDPLLSHVKLLAANWNVNDIYQDLVIPKYKNLAEYNDGYMNDLRRYLKGDEELVSRVGYVMKRNPSKSGVINYITNTNGFTLMDLYSYDIKHNEKNGEDSRDGSEYNYSWNCGVEGKTRRKKIVELRRKQIKNALLVLFLSQGTPLLLAGDEFGNSQDGNNNAYCQDNEISWLNWGLLKTNADILEYVKKLIKLRKAHRILHMEDEFRVMDYISCGCPDISFHGTKAWYPDYSNYSRVLGIMLCGQYAKLDRVKNDDYFYFAYNMHWETHEFDLPNLPADISWSVLVDTNEPAGEEFAQESKNQSSLINQKEYVVKPRSVVVFIGKS